MAQGSSNPSSNLLKVAGTAVDTNTGNASAGTQRVVLASNQPAVAVTGTFYQATQPVSLASVPTHGVTGTFWQATQPVSLTILPALATGTNAIGSITNTSFAATQSGTWNIATVTNLNQLGGTAISMNTGVRDAGTQRVTIATNDSVAVTGSFYQTTQPVSLASVPTHGVTGTFWQATQPVSAVALPLPTGAATSAKQPALGTAGTASADVITVQGIANGVAQPISGSVTVTQATAANLNATVTGTVELGATSLAALENISVTVPGTVDLGTISLTALETITVTSATPGNFQSKMYGAVTTATPAYTNATDNALSLTTSGALRVDGSNVTQPVSGTFWPTTQPVSGPLTDSQLRAAAVPVSLSTLPTLATVTNLVQFNGTAISMKAGSTAPAAADPALVVSLSPNSQQLAIPGTPFASAVTTGGALPASTIYYIKIVAVDAGGGTTAASGQLVYGTAAGTNTNVITLSWVPVAGADSYQVWWGIASSAQNNYFNAPINLSTSGELLNSYVFSTVSGSFSGTIPATNTSSFVRQKPTQPVSIAASVAVTGPLTDSQLRAAAVPVSLASVPTHGVTGTFWQTTQPVSQTVGSAATRWYTQLSDGTNSPAIKAASTAAVAADPSLVVSLSPNNTLGVTGTFWPTTQPVSGPLTDTQLRAAAVPITGTVTSLTQMNGQAISMNTGVRDAGTQRVTIATNDSVTVSGTVAATQSGTWTVQPGNTANTTPWLVKPLESLGTATVLGALNAEITQALNGNLGAAGVITAIATPVGVTLTPYASYDGGTNWTVTQFFNSVNGDAINTLTAFAVGNSYSISAGDGATHIKVRATGWTSGSVTVRLSATNSQGLVNLKSTAVHDEAAGSFIQQVGAIASSTAPTAVSANGDAVRLWATTSGALNVADGGGSITVDGTFWQATQPVSLASVPTHGVTGTFWQATQPVSGTFWQATQPVSIATLPALTAGSAAIGTVEIGATSLAALETITVLPGNTANTTPWLVKPAESLGTATALGALNAEITQALSGNLGVGFTITAVSAPTGITLTPYVSYDGGTNWTPSQFFDVSNALAVATLTTFAVGAAYSLSAGDGATHVKVRATGWTSGSVTVRLSSSNSQGLVNLKSTAVHDSAAGTYTQLVSGYASSTAPTAVTVGDASRIWTTLNGAVNIADGGGAITVDGTVAIGAGTALIGTVSLAGATTNALTNATTTAYAASLIIKASAGTIYTLNGYNSKTSGQFIQLYNSATLPANGVAPVVTFYVPGSSNFSFDWGAYGRSFSAGIVVSTSSTGPTKTIGAADCWFDATFK